MYSLWVDKMLKSRQEARTLREMLSFTKKKEEDPLLEYLLGFRDRMGQARALLTDASKTAFFFIALPEALPIAVITRFIGWFQEFGIPVGGVIVNMVMDPQALGGQVPEFVLNRLRMQEEHLGTIREKFGARLTGSAAGRRGDRSRPNVQELTPCLPRSGAFTRPPESRRDPRMVKVPSSP
ncbi:MAG: hypothetical protein DME06_02875 [Candidatus Rokuibacteriota bacterium]|nr:MAG: hypothetical protein DME06_02875 [Candidatus Rokubacteria bacterium]